jgi:predicted N-acetyltransferase YhbS
MRPDNVWSVADERIRIAQSDADIGAAVDVACAAFARGRPALVERAMRLSSARRARATPWVLEAGARIVASALCYPLTFGLPDGDVADGFGLGSVGTRPEARGRGHATALCRRMMEAAAGDGRAVGLLFSAIPPRLYERIGFAVCDACDFAATDPAALAGSGPPAALEPADPRRLVAELARMYAAAHAGRLHLHRDAAAWRQSVDDGEDWWFTIGDPARGYVRLADDPEELEIVELVLLDPDDGPPVVRAIAALAADLGRPQLRGWLDHTDWAAQALQSESRATTLPMISGIDGAPSARFWSSDYF